jgi:hypothetical protein
MSEYDLPISESALRARALHRARGDHHLADELFQIVCVQHLRGKFDPSRNVPFGAWADRCMFNYVCSLSRSWLRPAGDDLPERADPRDGQREVESALDLAAPFSPVDVDAIVNWPARDRVLLLCRGLLWRKFPQWDDALKELGLPAHFPGDGFEHLKQAERNAVLMRALGLQASRLCQLWKQGVPRLQELQFVRGLLA